MDLQLTGKRALVTGSSAGIGAAIAESLANEGVKVVVHGRNSAAADEIAGRIERRGGHVVVVLGDLSDDSTAAAVARSADEAFLGIDILVNNVGMIDQTNWMETPPNRWASMYNQSVISMVRMIQHFAPTMKARRWGRCIQMSSASAILPWPQGPDYCAAKAAVVNLSVGLAKELSGTGITANTVSPGPILTDGFERLFRIAKERGWGDAWDEIERHAVATLLPNPCGRIGRVEDVAACVTFLASPLAGYINGANLRVDGAMVPTVN
jgi:3-oxoacyl-[acyl-carrier protein] reductase